MIPGLSTAKLIGLAIAAAAILAFVTWSFSLRTKLEHRDAQLATICSATREAANQPKLDCAQAPQQIGFMGDAVISLSRSIDRQNALIAAQGAENVRQQAELTEAKKQADKRAEGSQATSARLAASANAPDRQTKPCAPSKALQEQWR